LREKENPMCGCDLFLVLAGINLVAALGLLVWVWILLVQLSRSNAALLEHIFD
jgi:hypothetical protein